MAEYFLVAALIFAVNLLPAFGPPTWALLVFFELNYDLAAVPLVATGALAAAAGRLTLAQGTRVLRPRLAEQRLRNLDAAEELLAGNREKALAGLALFTVSPIPSAQLFVAAGLLTVPLVPLTAAFFAGRVVAYSFYVAGAVAAKESIGDIAADALTSPLGIALQVVMLAGLVALVRVDWAALAARRRHSRG